MALERWNAITLRVEGKKTHLCHTRSPKFDQQTAGLLHYTRVRCIAELLKGKAATCTRMQDLACRRMANISISKKAKANFR